MSKNHLQISQKLQKLITNLTRMKTQKKRKQKGPRNVRKFRKNRKSNKDFLAGSFVIITLEQQCYSFLTQGLAPSTHHSSYSAQAKFISFCRQLGKLHPSGSPCPADERTLPFHHFSCQDHSAFFYQGVLIWVRALHIEQGFPDPLLNCLCPQRVVRGTKHCHGSSSSNDFPLPFI